MSNKGKLPKDKTGALTKEENEVFASHLKNIITAMDVILGFYPIERIKATAGNMRSHSGTAMSASVIGGEAGLAAAEKMEATSELFTDLVAALEARHEQIEKIKELESRKTGQAQIMKDLGFIF